MQGCGKHLVSPNTWVSLATCQKLSRPQIPHPRNGVLLPLQGYGEDQVRAGGTAQSPWLPHWKRFAEGSRVHAER